MRRQKVAIAADMIYKKETGWEQAGVGSMVSSKGALGVLSLGLVLLASCDQRATEGASVQADQERAASGTTERKPILIAGRRGARFDGLISPAEVPPATAEPQQQLTYYFPTRIQQAGKAGAVGIGDVDGDGQNEIVVAYQADDGNGYVNVYSERPDTTDVLRYSAATNAGYEYFFGGMQVADLNDDGVDEIVLGTTSGIEIFRLASGALQGATYQSAGGVAMNLIGIIDIDGDGKKDVVGLAWGNVMGDYNANAISLFYGDGMAGVSRTAAMSAPQRGMNDMKVADVTGDGLDDLVITSYQAYYFWVIPLEPGGGFGDPQAYPNPETYHQPGDISHQISGNAVGDFDSDGLNDIVAANGANLPGAAIWLYKQNDDHLLETPTKILTYDSPTTMMAGDLDRNGTSDLVVLHQGYGEMSYWLQEYGALVEAGRAPIVGYGASGADRYNNQGLAIGDYTGDGCPDIAIGDYNNGLVLVRAVECPKLKVPALPYCPPRVL